MLKMGDIKQTFTSQKDILIDSSEEVPQASSDIIINNKYLKYNGDEFYGFNVENILDKLDSGYYKFTYNQQYGNGLVKTNINTDELFELPFKESVEILKDIKQFWNSKEIYKKYNYIHKRGILLYGKQGNGKTSIINLLIKDVIENYNGIVLSINTPDDLYMFKDVVPRLIKTIEPNRPIICTIEDLNSMINHHGHSVKSTFLNILDGTLQINNIIYVATTNYVEELEENIKNRPSRFDRRYEIGLPDYNVRKAYLEYKINNEDQKDVNINKIAKDTKNFSIAHLKEFVISHFIFRNSYEESINRMKEFIDVKNNLKTKQDSSGNSGFQLKSN